LEKKELNPVAKWFLGTKWFRHTAVCHYIHHLDPRYNFNFTFCYIDSLIGTYRAPTEKDHIQRETRSE